MIDEGGARGCSAGLLAGSKIGDEDIAAAEGSRAPVLPRQLPEQLPHPASGAEALPGLIQALRTDSWGVPSAVKPWLYPVPRPHRSVCECDIPGDIAESQPEGKDCRTWLLALAPSAAHLGEGGPQPFGHTE